MLIMESSERFSDKVFLNGDVYVGNFKGIFPHGKGKYTWPDGTVYDGDWEEGQMTGKGKIFWPSGATYEGDFSWGYLHGLGTFASPDGPVYRGAWRMNIQHGLGKKEYCNYDIYEGSWKEGVREGSGKYVWSNGNTFIGNWKVGRMCGRGVMKWVNGDLFNGFWLNGFSHGSGFYRFSDGSYYFGTWTKGLKDGQGTYYPAGNKHTSLRELFSHSDHEGKGKECLSRSLSLNSEECRFPCCSIKCSLSINGSLGVSGRISHTTSSLDEGSSLCDCTRELSSCDISTILSRSSDRVQREVQGNTTVAFKREYIQGVLIREKVRRSIGASSKSKRRTEYQVKEVKKKSCLAIFEGRRSYHLMLNLQLGIRYTVGKITPIPMREVRASDFGKQARIQMYFPRKGSQFTPPHYSIDFYWKDYCPVVFRNLRDMFKLAAAAYMMSFCGDDGLRELSSPGKSGSIFYVSHDRFFIKTLQRSELKVLLNMLSSYYGHVKEHGNTLITKFFGLHQITFGCARKVCFVVMGNMFCTELRIHRSFDLKGSKHGRFTNLDKIDKNTTLKDLDLSYEFHMDKLLRESLFEQLNLDCMFLKSQQIIDYSLLLGLHFRAPEHHCAFVEPLVAPHKHESLPQIDGAISQGEIPIPPQGLLLVTHESSFVSTAPGPHSRGNTLRASWEFPETNMPRKLRVHLGVNMPAQASRKPPQHGTANLSEAELFEAYDVVLYLGIIDVLQVYNLKKKIEHALKSLRYDPVSISTVDPKLYSDRFIDFLKKVVFPDTEPQ